MSSNEIRDELERFPKRVPLLPLRDVVLFPGVSLPLFVGRERSVAAVERALEEDGLLFAVTQKSADITEPTPHSTRQARPSQPAPIMKDRTETMEKRVKSPM